MFLNFLASYFLCYRSGNIAIVFCCFGITVVCGRCAFRHVPFAVLVDIVAFRHVPFAVLVDIVVCLLQGCDVRFQSV